MVKARGWSRGARWMVVVTTGGLVAALMMVASGATGRGTSAANPILSCREVRNRVDVFLQNHYVFRSFDKELSRRSYGKFFETLDPGKFYFLKSDFAQFAKLEDKIDEQIAKADCGFIESVHKVFLSRVKERSQYADSLLAKPFVFNVAEDMTVGKQDWSPDIVQLNERWRKRIKFQVMTMKDPDGEPKAR
ncbi:MAG: hypothetical protein RI953_684, partial [Pseudomonadota bacterium]